MLIKKLVACINLKNSQGNSKKSSVDIIDSWVDSSSPMARAVAADLSKNGSSNT